MLWVIDDTVDLTGACERASWHLGSAIDALVTAGLPRRDAEAYVEFAFSDHAVYDDQRPQECLSDEQWNRLTVEDD